MSPRSITRRDFLRTTAVAPIAGTVRIMTSARRSRVVLIRDAKAVGEGRKVDAAVVQKMLDDAVAALFGEKDPAAAWKRIVQPADIVGLKTNSWNYLPTGPEIEQAIKRRVMEAGVPENRIGIKDRGVFSDPLFQQATALINARPARVHYWAGMGSCIKNYIQFVPKPSDYHNDACADLAAIWSLPIVKDKTRLNILSLLTPQYHNIGPRGFSEKYLWTYGGLIVGQDPVAVDATGYQVIQAQRRIVFNEDKPLETSAHHIQLADTRHKLGQADPAAIELIKLGWTEGILI